MDRFHIDEPGYINYQWEVPAFVIVLRTSFAEAGIRKYEAEIWARQDGSIIQEIDLPCFSCAPKTHVLAASEAARIAKGKGFTPSKLTAEVEYSETAGSIVWEFKQVVSRSAYGISYKTIQIDAHDGHIVHQGPSEAIF
jgi:hypothetical protein